MADLLDTDRAVVDHLRKAGTATIQQLQGVLKVTSTAVRQRLVRLLAMGYVARESSGTGRGRPVHQYRLTSQGNRVGGSNFEDLAMVLWEEMRGIRDESVRRGLIQRLGEKLSSLYAAEIQGGSAAERMAALAAFFSARKMPFELDHTDQGLPVLKAVACPYTELAERDRSVCAMEKIMLTELIGERLKLTECRLDGQSCCTYQVSDSANTTPIATEASI
jgi:DeoR family transcriptional regulator, suf operon transcriptional repressor